MTRRFEVLLAPPVLGALALLLANDFALKYAYPGLVTGKLSDFAGLFLFAVFWSALFPRHRLAVGVLTAAGFVFWKSPAAQPLIDAWNALPFLPAGRVVDPTDLVALLMLPIAYVYRPEPRPRAYGRLLGPAVGAACVFAFTATQCMTILNFVPVPDATYEFPFSREELLQRMYTLNLSYGEWDAPPTNLKSRLHLYFPPPVPDNGRTRRYHVQAVEVETFSTASGGSALRLLGVDEHTKAPHDTVRAVFERRVVERIRRNEPSPDRAQETGGRDEVLRPRILAPASLTESRGQVRISLRAPAHVALVEVTPQLAWRLIYPARPEDEVALGAGEHTLTTACAQPGAERRDVPPGELVPACAVTRPVTGKDVERFAEVKHQEPCAPGPGRFSMSRGIVGADLVLLAADAPLRRDELKAMVDEYCGITSVFFPEGNPLGRMIRTSRARTWAAAEVRLRR